MSFESTLNCFSGFHSCTVQNVINLSLEERKKEKHIVLTSSQKQNPHTDDDWVEYLCSQRNIFIFSRFNKNLYWIASGGDAHSYSNTRSREWFGHCYIPRSVSYNSHSCFHLRLLLILITFCFLPSSATSFININCHVHNVKCFPGHPPPGLLLFVPFIIVIDTWKIFHCLGKRRLHHAYRSS